jgi:4-diphosphocytidyl-2C-methyl-D-erythritol kinase
MDESQESISALLSEFGTRLNEVEEKQRLIKDRVLLIGENLVSTKEQYEKELGNFRKQISEITTDLKGIKQLNKRIVNELENYARKTEVEVVERQIRMFQPLEFARIQDVQRIVQKEMNNLKK